MNEEYKGKETKFKCKNCNSTIYKEMDKQVDYPYVCLSCDENMYGFEVAYNARIKNNKRYNNDKKYREYHSKKVSEHIKIKRKINPEYNKWTKLRQRKWRKENPEKSNNYAKNYRERQKESNRLVGM